MDRVDFYRHEGLEFLAFLQKPVVLVTFGYERILGGGNL